MDDLISRQAAIDALRGYLVGKRCPDDGTLTCRLIENEVINKLPPIQPDNNSEVPNSSDCISKNAALVAVKDALMAWSYMPKWRDEKILEAIAELLPAQPERRCVNCGRTVNNGGWYEDGRTRCPIEEHYALPKDGYCHLWEKRKDWEDDYVKRAEEGEK